MNASGSARAVPLGLVEAIDRLDDRRSPDIPAPLTERQQRRARLVARLARRRVGFLLLHVALGLAGWGGLILATTGVASLIR